MKHLYVCEKCNSEYESYEECCECESSHHGVDSYSYHAFSPDLEKREVYGKGGVLPVKIVLVSNEYYNVTKNKNVRQFAEYTLQRVLRDDEVEQIYRDAEQREAKTKAFYERWCAEQEEKKKAEEREKSAE